MPVGCCGGFGGGAAAAGQRLLGALAADGVSWPRLLGEAADRAQVRRADDDARRIALLRIDLEELRRFQPPLGIADFAGVDQVAVAASPAD